jgi:transposase
LIEATPGDVHLIDSTTAKARCCAAGGKGTFLRLIDFRRIATPYDKLSANYAAAVARVAIVT